MIGLKRRAVAASLSIACVLVLVGCGGQIPETASPADALATSGVTGQATLPVGANPQGTDSGIPPDATGQARSISNALGSSTNPLILAFIPSHGRGDAEANAAQFASRLSSTTGLVIEAHVGQTNAEVVDSLCSGQAHMAVLNTAYIAARERGCADAALAAMRDGLPITRGQVIARADSGISQIGDLTGHSFCRESRFSASAWVVPALLMRTSGLDPESDLGLVQDVGTHPEVVRAVYRGECDAGATYVDAREELLTELPDVMDEVIVVATTDAIPNEIIAFHPNVPDEIRQQLVETLLAVTEDEAGTQILAALYEWDSLIEIDDTLFEVYDPVLSAPGVEPDDFLGD
jgi:phosphonate transport system substrate-binding protein